MANDKPDVNRVIGWLRATGPIVIGIVGLVVTWKIGRIQEDRSEHEFQNPGDGAERAIGDGVSAGDVRGPC